MLASYLQFQALNINTIYVFAGAVLVVWLAMVLFRGIGRLKENHQVQRSSWRTFEKVARVRGLNVAEARVLAQVVRRCRVKRPTQVLGSIQLFDRCMDRALERGYLADHEGGLLESARSKLLSTNQPWDGRHERRQFERADCSFPIRVFVVTKEGLDEELRTAYQEGDAQFARGLETIVGQSTPMAAEVQDISAGGLALALPETDEARDGDYISLQMGDAGGPVNLQGMVARVLGRQHLEHQHQTILHLGFLAYDQERKRQIIQLVHTTEPVPRRSHGGKEEPSPRTRRPGPAPGPTAPVAGPPRPNPPPDAASQGAPSDSPPPPSPLA
ncbi:MAG: PilZ domain-containing protein [Gemmatimonadota bacterium]